MLRSSPMGPPPLSGTIALDMSPSAGCRKVRPMIIPTWVGGEFLIAKDIFRGRYRESFANPKPIERNKPSPIDSPCLRPTMSFCPSTVNLLDCSALRVEPIQTH